MFTETYKSVTDQFEKVLSPYAEFNKLLTQHIQKLTELNVNSICTYSDEGIATLNALGNVKDFSTLVAFNSQQMQSVAKISKQCIEDCRHYADIVQQFKRDVDNIYSERSKAAKTV